MLQQLLYWLPDWTMLLCCRLNKIGKNPHLVSNRETLDSDCKTMNAIVNALSGGGSDVGSLESLPLPSSPRPNLTDLGRILASANMPRAASHCNVFDSQDNTPSSPTNKAPAFSSQPPFHKSDIFLERPPPPPGPPSLGTFLEFPATSPFRQVKSQERMMGTVIVCFSPASQPWVRLGWGGAVSPAPAPGEFHH